jgi:hypothetical protein
LNRSNSVAAVQQNQAILTQNATWLNEDSTSDVFATVSAFIGEKPPELAD